MSRFESVKRVSSTLRSYDLGMERKSVSLKNHSPQWAKAFTWVKELLNHSIPRPLDCYHVGSTSLPGIAAKPALDILCLFDSEADIQASIPILEKLGFVYKGDAVAKLHGRASEEGRHFFLL